MRATVGSLLPLALAVTISPLPIAAEILLLFTEKPRANALAYLVGFLVGVGAVLGLLVALAGAVNLSSGSGTADGAGGLQIALGVVLLVAAGRRFRRRPEPGHPVPPPRWMAGISSFSPSRSLVVGVAIGALNPKNIAVALAAAVVIGSAGLSTGQTVGTIVVYLVVAVLGVAAPLVVVVAMGARSTPVLESWRSWLEANNATVMAVILAVFGVVLLGRGIAGA